MAMKQVMPVLMLDSTAAAAGNDEFAGLWSSSDGWANTTTSRESLFPAGNITRLEVKLPADPGADFTLTIHDDGVATSATVTITSGNTTGSWSGTVAVAAGSLMTMEYTNGDPSPGAQTGVSWCTTFEPTDDKAVYPVSENNDLHATATEYMYAHPVGVNAAWNTSEVNRSVAWGVAGTVGDLHVELETAPTSGNSFTFSFMLNGVHQAGGPSVAIADTATSNNDTSNTFAIVAGDRISIRCVPSGTPTTGWMRLYFTVDPTTADNYSLSGGGQDFANNNEYTAPGQVAMTWSGTEADRDAVFGEEQVATLAAVVTEAAVTSGSRTVTVRDDGASTACAATISSGTSATGGSDATVAQGSLLSILQTESSPGGGGDVKAAWAIKPVAGAPSGRIMSSLAGPGGLAGKGGIAGPGGGLAA